VGLQKVLKLLWRRRLRTLCAHDVSPVSNVPDWNTNVLTRGVQRERQHQSRTAGAHFALDLSSTHALPLLCSCPQRLLELAEPVLRSLPSACLEHSCGGPELLAARYVREFRRHTRFPQCAPEPDGPSRCLHAGCRSVDIRTSLSRSRRTGQQLGALAAAMYLEQV
jgi:hypothetical protein